MSAPTPSLIDAIYRDRIERAKRMPPDEKFLAGPRLFDAMREWTKAGIREQFPNASDEEIERRFRERLVIARQLEDAA